MQIQDTRWPIAVGLGVDMRKNNYPRSIQTMIEPFPLTCRPPLKLKTQAQGLLNHDPAQFNPSGYRVTQRSPTQAGPFENCKVGTQLDFRLTTTLSSPR